MKYIINIHAEIGIEALEEIVSFTSQGWEMVDFTPNRIVLEKQFEFEGNLNTLKEYASHTCGMVDSIYDEDINLIYSEEKGWLTK